MSAPESLRDEVAAVLAEVVKSVEIRELARKAVEDELIEWRDAGRSMPFRNNGCVVKYRDGTPSDIIRFGPETAVVVGVSAIASQLADALLASPALARVIRERESDCGCTPGADENGWHETRCSACAAQDRQQWEDAMEKSEVLGHLIRKGRSDLQARLDAIAAYAGHPGNWGTGDARGRLIHDLATGAIDPTSRDWGDTNLPETHGGGA